MWLYGSKSDQIKPVINTQNPDIKDLVRCWRILAHARS